ncbi:hypothetical protein [Dactylosporangium sp. CA-139066]|uniref:hypothetical protein n=1 Tax=Dactylosporangium sp. CA-139066 TaxID=3239930 RepID=UPI003D9135BF
MTDERDEIASAAIFAVKRHAAQLRTDPAAVNVWLYGLDEYQLRTMLGAALALVPPGPVADLWWQRDGDVHAHRRAILLGEVA